MHLTGVNVIGRFLTSVGTTIAGFAVIEALQRAGVPIAMLSLTDGLSNRPPEALPNVQLVNSPSELPYKTTIILDSVLVLDMMLNQFRDELADHHLSTVLYWELDYMPRRWEQSFARFDSIFAPTMFVADALRRSYGQRSSLMPVTPLHNIARTTARDPGKPFTFFTHFDALSTLERKNPLGAIEAFERAFGKRQDVRLLVKVWESPPWELDRAVVEQLERHCSNVEFIFDHLTYEQTLGLIRDCDAYVSLHRTEGLGLGMLEAMSFGKPVIATDYAGNRDFLDAFSGMPVPYTLVPVDTSQKIYAVPELGTQAYWADANLDAAAAHMQRLKDDELLYFGLSAGAFARYHERRQQFLDLGWLPGLGMHVPRALQSV